MSPEPEKIVQFPLESAAWQQEALNEEQWVRVEDNRVYLTKIFDWYADDFKQDGGSILGFISGYRDTDLVEGEMDVKFMDYNWSLNETN